MYCQKERVEELYKVLILSKDLDKVFFPILIYVLKKEKIQDCLEFLSQDQNQILLQIERQKVDNLLLLNKEQTFNSEISIKRITDVLKQIRDHEFNQQNYSTDNYEEIKKDLIIKISFDKKIIEFLRFLVHLTALDMRFIQSGSNSLHLLIEMKIDCKECSLENISIRNTQQQQENLLKCHLNGSTLLSNQSKQFQASICDNFYDFIAFNNNSRLIVSQNPKRIMACFGIVKNKSKIQIAIKTMQSQQKYNKELKVAINKVQRKLAKDSQAKKNQIRLNVYCNTKIRFNIYHFDQYAPIKSVVSKNPKNAYFYIKKGMIPFFDDFLAIPLEKMNRLNEALEYYDLAIEINPEISEFYYRKGIIDGDLLGLTLNKMKRFEEALECYDSAIYKNPQESCYYNCRANTLNEMKKFDQALKYYNLAIQKDPNNPILINNKDLLGNTLDILKRFEEALKYYNLAISKNPEISDSYNRKAITLNKMHLFEESLENSNLAIYKNKEISRYYYIKANTLSKMKRFEEALENYDLAIQKDPEVSDFYGWQRQNQIQMITQRFHYFSIYLKTNLDQSKFEDALVNFDLAIQLNPEDSRHYI
ncbi:unnamed protein product (macronuclear) [Paramecium tetraurelia]|uniref:Tetratricopeptide repeat protein n=1 Tax=Paramecium tetraurelia TaxID=5888 RepID=A0CRS0_PARTE|nr:uncharacterized protein GSPATT00009802001 [Paramecium tetraurelia]CAK73487.1 unnamed protein product [Paramecium tetraurelia]|eukprot:XP_001440884.1 hypothetical protein (macronuclear) [Paramecium tetraurelia strain d4-2]